VDVFAPEEDAVGGRQLNILFVESINQLVKGLPLFHDEFAAVAVIEPDEHLQPSVF
jgi:hypothetical protein